MKKMAKIMLALTAALLILTGCSKTSKWTLTVNNKGVYSVVSTSSELNTFAWRESVENCTADFNITGDGEFSVVVEDEAGKQYTITLVSKDGKVECTTDDGISVDLNKR